MCACTFEWEKPLFESVRDSVHCLEQSTEILLPVEQGVQTYLILFVWGHDPST